MSLPVGTILKIVCTLTAADSNIIQNIFNAIITGSGGPFDEDDITDDLVDWLDDMFANVGAHIRVDIDPTEAVAYEYDSVDDDWDEFGTGIPTFTTLQTDHALPRGVALLLNARTTDADVNGKKYIGGMTESTWESTTWSAILITAAVLFGVDWATPFVGAASGATMTPAIWSPTNLVAYPLSGVITIPTIAAYQRRRKPGVGI